MRNALKVLALGVAVATSATMAKATTLGPGDISVGVGGCDAQVTTTSCPSGFNETTGTGIFITGQPNPINVMGDGSLSAFTGASFSGSSQYIPYNVASGTQLFTATAGNGEFLVFDTNATGQHDTMVDGTFYDFSATGTLTLYTNSSMTSQIGNSLGYVGVNPNGQLLITGLVSTAATPEPSSLALLGTGLLGAAGMARRRFLRK